MIINPVLPIWIVAISCLALIIIIIKSYKEKDIDRYSFIRRLLLVLIIFMINIRPMFPGKESQSLSYNIDVLFVIDTTISMVAEDYEGNNLRIDGVKKDAEEIIEQFAGSRFAVLNFDNVTHIAVPFTTDSDMCLAAIDALQPVKNFFANGSSIDIAIDEMEKILSSANKKNDRVQIVFYLGDGEQTSVNKIKSFKKIKKYINGGMVLGYGTSSGGYMKNNDTYQIDDEDEIDYKNEYIEDTTSDEWPFPKAVSKINETNLKNIAKELGVSYQHRNKKSSVKDITKKLKQKNYKNTNRNLNTYEDIYWMFGMIFIIVLYFEIWINKNKIIL